jgi:NitT/TauT family transport system ATP-binding protein
VSEVLEARELSRVYDADEPEQAVRALDGVSFTVERDEFVVVVGPSGCGKSTLLRLFAGLIEPTSGAAIANGEPVTGPDPDRAMVFQEFNLFPWRTTRGNVAFGLEMRGVPEAERNRIAGEYIELVGLDGFAGRYPDELSGGMRQRVGLARALAVDPSVLLMDEPFGAVDARTRETLQRELLRIRERDRKTIRFVTHDIDEALVLADRVLVMGADPNRIAATIDVPFDRPRYGRGLETTAEFTALERRVRSVLRDEGPDDETTDEQETTGDREATNEHDGADVESSGDPDAVTTTVSENS